MNCDRSVFEKALGRLISGKDIHAELECVFDGLDWKLAGARPEGAPYSVFQLLNHMAYWQEWVEWLDGQDPPLPEHASGSWPDSPAPADSEEWEKAVRRFRKGLDDLQHRSRQSDPLSKLGEKSRLEMLQAGAAHNSYHAGQVVLLRKMLGAWPPPSGGLTW